MKRKTKIKRFSPHVCLGFGNVLTLEEELAIQVGEVDRVQVDLRHEKSAMSTK
jgi:hypothetical protein